MSGQGSGISEPLFAAIDLAARARANGNHPFGALLTDADGRTVLTAENTVTTERDCTGHAETNLIRLASARFSRQELALCTLYTSTEPCAMCAGAIYWSGVGRVVFALGEDELFELTGSDPENPTMRLDCRTVFAAGSRSISVVGPAADGSALAGAARAVHLGFWSPGE